MEHFVGLSGNFHGNFYLPLWKLVGASMEVGEIYFHGSRRKFPQKQVEISMEVNSKAGRVEDRVKAN